MTATTNDAARQLPTDTERTRLMGFGPFIGKELAEWWASRRAIVVFVVMTLLIAGTTVGPWLQAAFPPAGGQPGPSVSLDPTRNLLGANWNQWLTFVAVFASMGLLAGERDKGTLAWSLSKPLSRAALLLAKWSAGALVLSVAGLLLPMLVGVAVATAAYGTPPELGSVARYALAMLAIPAFYVGLSIVLGTRLPSQAAVAGIGLAVSFLPSFAGLISVDLARAMPPAMSDWALALATGASVGPITPVGWLIGMALLAGGGYLAFERAEL